MSGSATTAVDAVACRSNFNQSSASLSFWVPISRARRNVSLRLQERKSDQKMDPLCHRVFAMMEKGLFLW